LTPHQKKSSHTKGRGGTEEGAHDKVKKRGKGAAPKMGIASQKNDPGHGREEKRGKKNRNGGKIKDSGKSWVGCGGRH